MKIDHDNPFEPYMKASHRMSPDEAQWRLPIAHQITISSSILSTIDA